MFSDPFYTLSKIILCITIVFINFILGQNTVGLILNEPDSFEGYTLFAPNNSTTTYLIDNNGLLVNQWESAFSPGLTVYLLEDGHLLRAAKVESDNSTDIGGFQKFSWDNNLVWEFYYGFQHHDIEPMPNGNVLMIANDIQSTENAISAGRDPELISSTNIRSLSIIEIMQVGIDSGSIVWEWHAWDHLIQDFDETKLNYGNVSLHPELIDINFARNGHSDWLHTNSIDYSADYDQIIISNRNTNEVWIIDHSTTIEEAASHSGGNSGHGGDILYRWGNPISYRNGDQNNQKFFGQHDAHWIGQELIGSGNLMVFNNGYGRPVGAFSTIDEIIPPIDSMGNYSLTAENVFGPAEPIWTYSSEDSSSFFSPRFGSAQRLSNGNTLICASDSGLFFEISSAFEVVWKYINPISRDGILFQGDPAINNTVARCIRYGPDYPGFFNHDLTPGGPLELYLNISDSNINYIPEYHFFTNYPNPFNSTTRIRYYLPEDVMINITIYDMVGREIKNIVNTEQSAGYKSFQWNARNNSGQIISAGLYLYTIEAGEFRQTKKMILLK